MAGFTNIAALLGSEVTPAERTKIRWLTRGPEAEAEAQAAAPADASVALNPAFQPPGEQGFSLAGNAPVGRASLLGSALLDNAAPVTETPPARKRLAFAETAGGKTTLALVEKRKKLKWWMPDFVANRNERDMAQALEMARLEMGFDEAEDVSHQRAAAALDERLSRQEKADRARQDFDAGQEELKRRREERNRVLLEESGFREKKLAQEDRRLDLTEEELRAKERHQRQAAALLSEPKPEKAPAWQAPAWQAPFAKWLESARGGYATPEERDAMRSEYQRLMGAPGPAGGPRPAGPVVPSHSSPLGPREAAALTHGAGNGPPVLSGRVGGSAMGGHRTAVDPKTGQRFYVFPDGRVEPAP